VVAGDWTRQTDGAVAAAPRPPFGTGRVIPLLQK
jgi:hypothetical protein